MSSGSETSDGRQPRPPENTTPSNLNAPPPPSTGESVPTPAPDDARDDEEDVQAVERQGDLATEGNGGMPVGAAVMIGIGGAMVILTTVYFTKRSR